VYNFGNIYNSGTITSQNGGIQNFGNIENLGTIYNTLGTSVNNYGVIDNSGTFKHGFDSILRNFGTMHNSGTISSDFGIIENEGIINNSGTLSQDTGVEFVINNGTINNCITGIINGPIGGNAVNAVICPGEEDNNVQLTSITVTGAATTVENGKTLQMTATVNPATATNKDVTWSVAAGTGNATITQTGLLTGTKEGNVTIKAMAKDGSGVQGSSVITVTAAKTVSSGGGGGSGGGGSGGSGSSGEKTQNIALKDVSSIFVGKGSIKFDFKNPDNDIQYIEYTSLKNSGTITATVEVLKERSTFAASSPKGVIYKHINIWLGKTGYVTETNLESPVIGFRVDKSWIEDEAIDPASVVLNRYSGDKWNVLSTTQTGSDEKYYYYQSETPGFSPFAITGVSLDEAAVHSTNDDEINEHVSFVDLNGTEAQAEKNLPGLPFTVTLLIVSIACFLKRKQ
jgi:PGF-pre-PGF domain-containing protein